MIFCTNFMLLYQLYQFDHMLFWNRNNFIFQAIIFCAKKQHDISKKMQQFHRTDTFHFLFSWYFKYLLVFIRWVLTTSKRRYPFLLLWDLGIYITWMGRNVRRRQNDFTMACVRNADAISYDTINGNQWNYKVKMILTIGNKMPQ